MTAPAPNRSIGVRTLAAASGKAYWQMQPPSLPPPAISNQRIRSIEVILATAVQTELGLLTAAPATIFPPAVLYPKTQSGGPAGTAGSFFGVNFTVDPNILPLGNLSYIRRGTLPAVIGSKLLWLFEDGELIFNEVTSAGALILQNLGGAPGGLLDVNCTYYGV